MDLRTHGAQLQSLLDLRSPAVALAFRAEPPPNVHRISEPAPAGCGYWKLAGDGQVFFTEASDHYNCPIGAHTHGVDLPAEVAQELEGLVGTMVQIEYITMEDLPKIPRRSTGFGVAVYAPLTAAPVAPDVVLVRGNPKQMMLVAEAAQAAGIGHEMAAKLRPTCAIVPEAAEAGQATLSLGCIGNRIYTGLRDDEMYCAIPASQVPAIVEKLETIITANRALEIFHHQRKPAP
ncbi:MAG: DUF169 domain-containing protein [Candidatus Methylomirabilales bacterium]